MGLRISLRIPTHDMHQTGLRISMKIHTHDPHQMGLRISLRIPTHDTHQTGLRISMKIHTHDPHQMGLRISLRIPTHYPYQMGLRTTTRISSGKVTNLKARGHSADQRNHLLPRSHKQATVPWPVPVETKCYAAITTLCCISKLMSPFSSKFQNKILRCIIPVVLSNNKNKLNGIYMYIVTNTTIFIIVRLLLLRYNYMFRPSMLAIFRLYMKPTLMAKTCSCTLVIVNIL